MEAKGPLKQGPREAFNPVPSSLHSRAQGCALSSLAAASPEKCPGSASLGENPSPPLTSSPHRDCPSQQLHRGHPRTRPHKSRTRAQATVTGAAGPCSQEASRSQIPGSPHYSLRSSVSTDGLPFPAPPGARCPQTALRVSSRALKPKAADHAPEPTWRLTGRFGGQGGGRRVVRAGPLPLHGAPLLRGGACFKTH